METNEKKEALNYALSQTGNIIDIFESVMRKDIYRPKNHDFADVASRPIKKPEPVEAKPASIPAARPVVQPVAKPVAKPIEEEPHVFIEYDDIRTNMSLEELKAECSKCTRCRLCEKRTNTVFGEGCEDRPDVLVIGEGPGENEDLTGRPFVGAAGQYLDRWLASISLFRDKNVYIANIVKCRPPENRDPKDDEKEACSAFVKQQINLIKPKAILCLGKPSSTFMTGKTDSTMGDLRGHFFLYDNSIPMICTYHPAAVLRNIELKRSVWEDLKKLAMFLGLEIITKK